jgi:hypothetical protein
MWNVKTVVWVWFHVLQTCNNSPVLQLHQMVHLFHRIRRRLWLCTDSNFLLQRMHQQHQWKPLQQLTEIQLCGNKSERKVEKIRYPAGWILVTCWNLLSRSGIWGLGAFICPKSPLYSHTGFVCLFTNWQKFTQ